MCALIAGVAAVVLTMIYVSSRRSLLAFSNQLIVQVTATTREQVTKFLGPARTGIDLTRRLARTGTIDPRRVRNFEAFAFDFLRVHRSTAMLYCGDLEGNFLMVKRRPDGSLATKIVRRTDGGRSVATTWRHREPGARLADHRTETDPNDRYDPRRRPWFVHWTRRAEANAAGPRHQTAPDTVHWTDVYLFHSDQKPGITASLPYFDREGKFRGVFGIDVALGDLSHFLAGLKISEHGKAFLLDRRGRLVALPDLAGLLVRIKRPDGSVKTELRDIHDSPDPALAALAREVDAHPGWDARRRRAFAPICDGKRYVATLAPVSEEVGADWRIGVIAPEDDFLGEIKHTMLVTLAIVGAAMAVSFALALGVSRLVARAMHKLVRESAQIRDLQFSASARPVSTFKEVHSVLTAFENMKTGLRSFEKYVPAKMVRLLLAAHVEPAYGGDARELTVLFSDIRDFTPLCEKMDGLELSQRLGAYFSALTDCIQNGDSQGIVDKYIGDSVMAFWGAPEAVDAHAAKACRAALACLRAVADLRAGDPDFPEFHTRIGLHTDRVVVGNFGSSERLNYTCFGDGVNLTARLESLNKLYGTQILLSEQTRHAAGEGFAARHLDRVAVKGKAHGVDVYELLGLDGEVDAQLLEAAAVYEEALKLYRDRQWDRAAERFTQALELREGDLAAAVMIERCCTHAEHPPDDDWDGLTILDKK